ncbi:MAG TPA: MinD/ParA family protein [Methanosarcinales archaeon]|nr:MinD/ParA family protein [Methanosarcinales archaeon]
MAKKIIAIHSFRGGTGKSNITANVAVYIALQGYRVGIIDADIQSPGIHVIFGFDESNIYESLNDYLWGRCAIKDIAYDVTGNIGIKNGEVYFIPSSMKAGEIARILREGYDAELLNDGLKKLMKIFEMDYLFIDTHPGLNEETLISAAISDAFIIVLRPDNQDYQGTSISLEVSRRIGITKTLLVINKIPSSYELTEVRTSIQEAYECEVIGAIPLFEDLAKTGSKEVFILKNPSHSFSKAISEIAENIMES